MNLLLDIGNTNLRWAIHDAGELGAVQTLRHAGGIPLDLLAIWEKLAEERRMTPARIVVSNVGGAAVAEALRRTTRAYWKLEPEFIDVHADFGGVSIAYAEPARLGVDRWLALIAAHRRTSRDTESGQATVILDAGTAATFDLLLADGRHLGGLILPGIDMMRASLLAGTQIPRFAGEPSGAPWASDTETAVTAGSVQAIAALAERLFDRLAERSGTTPRLLLTGGDAQRLCPALERPFQEIPDLVLRGLAQTVAPASGK